MAHDVFISYSTKDKPIADAVCATLEASKIRCWIAPRDVLPGLSFASAIVNAIHEARVMVLIFSGHSNNSGQVINEVERAVHRGIPIIPLRIENVAPSGDMEYFISRRHWLDALTPPLERHLEKLTATVQLLLQQTSNEASPPTALPSMSEVADEPTLKYAPQTGLANESGSYAAASSRSRRMITGAGVVGVVLIIALFLSIYMARRSASPAVQTADGVTTIEQGGSLASNSTTPTPTVRSLTVTPLPSPPISKPVGNVSATGTPSTDLRRTTPIMSATASLTAGSTVRSPTAPALSATVGPSAPLTRPANRLAEVTLVGGENFHVAADWLVYGEAPVEVGLPLVNHETIAFDQMKSFEIQAPQYSSDITITVSLLGGDIFTDKVKQTGTLRAPSDQHGFVTEIRNVKKVDFEPSSPTPLLVNMATVLTTDGYDFETPVDLMQLTWRSCGIGGCGRPGVSGIYSSTRLVIPFSRIRSIQMVEHTAHLTLVDSRTVDAKLDFLDSPTITGVQDLGPFYLDVAKVKVIDFHRLAEGPATPSAATITLRDGKTVRASTDWLMYDGGDPVPLLGLPSRGKGTVPFTTIRSFSVGSGQGYDKSVAIMTLTDGTQYTDDLWTGGSIRGINQSGQFSLKIDSLKGIDFEPRSQQEPQPSMTVITTTDDSQVETPTDLLRFRLRGCPYCYYSDKDGLPLTSGVTVAFSRMKSFEVAAGIYRISLLDGKTVEGKVADDYTYPALVGPTDLGMVAIELKQLKKVDFRR